MKFMWIRRIRKLENVGSVNQGLENSNVPGYF